MNPIGLLDVQIADGPTFVPVPASALVSVDYERGNDQAGLNDDLGIGTASVVLKGNDWTQAARPFIKNRARIRLRGRVPEKVTLESHRWTGTPGASISEKLIAGTVAARNLAQNPKLRTNVNGYTLTGIAATFPSGTYARLRATAARTAGNAVLQTAAGSQSPATPGDTYTLSVDLRGAPTQLYLFFVNASGGLVPGVISGTFGGSASTWVRGTVTTVAPASAVFICPIVVNAAAMPINSAFEVRDMRVTQGSDTAYFDGDTATSTVTTPAQSVTVWQGYVGTPVTTYYRNRPPLTVIPATDVFGAASKTKMAGGFVGGNYDQRLGAACNARAGSSNYLRKRIGANDSEGTAFNTGVKDVTHLEAFVLVRNSRQGWIWASRDDERGIVYRTPESPPPAVPVLTFADSYAQAGALYYTDIDMTHDGNGFVTAVTLVKLAKLSTDSDVTVGTYRDATALAAGYERIDETVEAYDFRFVSGGSEADAAMKRQQLPAAMVRSVSIDVTDTPGVIENDLIYQPVRILNSDSGHDAVYHIISEKHRADAHGWHATYTLRALPANRTITVTQDT